MKTHPIIFSALMVRALLEGSKTQTRRILKPQPTPDATGRWTYVVSSTDKQQEDCMQYCVIDNAGSSFTDRGRERVVFSKRSPYGQPGDQLWVRETWQGPLLIEGDDFEAYRESPDDFKKPDYCEYAADGGPKPEFMTDDDELVCRWRPSIFMPRWASRITLKILSVRVKRLQDINEADAIAEGVDFDPGEGGIYWVPGSGFSSDTAKGSYRLLWESINGSESWDLNPWVWVIEFKKVAA